MAEVTRYSYRLQPAPDDVMPVQWAWVETQIAPDLEAVIQIVRALQWYRAEIRSYTYEDDDQGAEGQYAMRWNATRIDPSELHGKEFNWMDSYIGELSCKN